LQARRKDTQFPHLDITTVQSAGAYPFFGGVIAYPEGRRQGQKAGGNS
jgi:hypothetical protein